MAKQIIIAAVIVSAMHTGYRRANIAFDKGENRVEITEEQLSLIEQDSNLLVQSAKPIEALKPSADNNAQGSVDNDHVEEPVAKEKPTKGKKKAAN